MPRISAFYGIVISMYFRDHGPPHFHAAYGEHEAILAIESGELIEGRMPGRALRLVRQWAELHRTELETNWARARSGKALRKIDPLP